MENNKLRQTDESSLARKHNMANNIRGVNEDTTYIDFQLNEVPN